MEYFWRVLGGQERFIDQVEMAWMASRQGEQQALRNCERAEQVMFSEYKQRLRLCQEEGNHGVNYRQSEVVALQKLIQFQSDELNAQR
eukprot:12883686-Prorocentrum_lima.AAC.1